MERIVLAGFMDVNCYLLESSGKCLIIDPGFEKGRVIEKVREMDLDVVGILLTHGHIDHIGAIDCFPVPIYIHEADRDMLCDPEANGSLLHDALPPYDFDELDIVLIKEGDSIGIGEESVTVIHTPGHTSGSVCYRFKDCLYTGDTLFKESVGRWDFIGGDMLSLKKSIVSLIDKNEDNIIIYPGHGPSSTIREERMNNKYYFSWKHNN